MTAGAAQAAAAVGALGLAVAFTSPVSVVTVIVLLSMPSGRRRAIAFLVGWLLAIAAIGTIMVFVLHGQDFSSRSSTPSRLASALEIVKCLVDAGLPKGVLSVVFGVPAFVSTHLISSPIIRAMGGGIRLFHYSNQI